MLAVSGKVFLVEVAVHISACVVMFVFVSFIFNAIISFLFSGLIDKMRR